MVRRYVYNERGGGEELVCREEMIYREALVWVDISRPHHSETDTGLEWHRLQVSLFNV